MPKVRFLIAIGVITYACVISCGHSQLIGQIPPDESESAGLASFSLASDFPADIVIPDIDGMRQTAFVVSTSTPAGVIAIDINDDPMEVSSEFEGVLCPEGSGIPSRLIISSTDEAFLLTSNSIISFNPSNGEIYQTLGVLGPIEIGTGYENSDGTEAETTITPTYPGGIARIGEKIFASNGNYISTEAPAVAAPGTVQVFQLGGDHTLNRIGFFVTSGFNPTGLSVRNELQLIAVNSGVIDIVDAAGVPQTQSSIDIVDPNTLEIVDNIPLGMAGASFHDVALTLDGSRGFIGSVSSGFVYEIDFINHQVLRGTHNPHIITSDVDYISDVTLSPDNRYFFASSFETSAVYPLDLSANPPLREEGFSIGFPSGVTPENPSGANTGAGPLAIRPGIRSEDYEGADLYVLTGYPGRLIAIDTSQKGLEYTAMPNESVEESIDDGTPTPGPMDGNDGDSCQGFAQEVHSVEYGDGAGFGQGNFPDVVLGPPRGAGTMSGSIHVLSLGHTGEIILDLGNCPAVDGPGVDFIVFENAFLIGGNENAPYAELGTVGVSEDGNDFIEFGCPADTYPYWGCAGWRPVLSNPGNAISPFEAESAGGEAFDLADVGMARVHYIRIRDLAGSGSGGTAGFDLDAVAVVNGMINNP